MEEPTKGTVTPFASMFPFDEAQKAVKRVEDAIAEKQKELDHLKQFIADNTNLINLVSCLPDELHHDVMVTLCSLHLPSPRYKVNSDR